MAGGRAPTGPPHRPGLHPLHVAFALVLILAALYLGDMLVVGLWEGAMPYVMPAYIVYAAAALLVRARDRRAWDRQVRLR